MDPLIQGYVYFIVANAFALLFRASFDYGTQQRLLASENSLFRSFNVLYGALDTVKFFSNWLLDWDPVMEYVTNARSLFHLLKWLDPFLAQLGTLWVGRGLDTVALGYGLLLVVWCDHLAPRVRVNQVVLSSLFLFANFGDTDRLRDYLESLATDRHELWKFLGALSLFVAAFHYRYDLDINIPVEASGFSPEAPEKYKKIHFYPFRALLRSIYTTADVLGVLGLPAGSLVTRMVVLFAIQQYIMVSVEFPVNRLVGTFKSKNVSVRGLNPGAESLGFVYRGMILYNLVSTVLVCLLWSGLSTPMQRFSGAYNVTQYLWLLMRRFFSPLVGLLLTVYSQPADNKRLGETYFHSLVSNYF